MEELYREVELTSAWQRAYLDDRGLSEWAPRMYRVRYETKLGYSLPRITLEKAMAIIAKYPRTLYSGEQHYMLLLELRAAHGFADITYGSGIHYETFWLDDDAYEWIVVSHYGRIYYQRYNDERELIERTVISID